MSPTPNDASLSLNKMEPTTSYGDDDDKAVTGHHEFIPNMETLSEEMEDTDAAGFTDASVVIDDATNKRLRRMINMRILPLMTLAYLMQAMDKSTTGTASIMGLLTDTKMGGQDYALTSTFLWCGVIVGELPANRIVQMFPVAKLLSGALILWGIILIITAFMNDYRAIWGLRFALGLAESVVGPILLSISVMWYKKGEQPLILACYQSMLGMSGILSSLLGYGFYFVTGSALKGWQYMFICVAVLSTVSGVLVGVFMPDSPPKAKCYSDADKILFVERVRGNDQGIKNRTFKRHQVIEALVDPFVWMLFSLMIMYALVVGGLGTFSGILIKTNFGFTTLQSQLLGIPLGVMTILTYFLSAWLVTKTQQTFLVLVAFTLPNIIGTIVLIVVQSSPSTKGGLVVAFYIMQFFQAANPMLFTLLSRNVAGQTKKTFAYAIIFVGWAGGNVVAPQLFQAQWAPRYLNTLYIHCALYGSFIILCLVTRQYLIRRNIAKEAAGRMVVEGEAPANKHSHAFADLTDRENPDFRYCI